MGNSRTSIFPNTRARRMGTVGMKLDNETDEDGRGRRGYGKK